MYSICNSSDPSVLLFADKIVQLLSYLHRTCIFQNTLRIKIIIRRTFYFVEDTLNLTRQMRHRTTTATIFAWQHKTHIYLRLQRNVARTLSGGVRGLKLCGHRKGQGLYGLPGATCILHSFINAIGHTSTVLPSTDSPALLL